ncbi:MAG: ABC transporter ATP-binding protein [Gammaproteobacteria bacterium]|nr:ABC transporter ATP-binding protein [Gammaproteobacteria bacterium]
MPNSNTPLLSIKNLSVDFKQGNTVNHAVKNVSFDVFSGETLALVGESGSGKSVTALSVLKLLPYPAASHPSGEIHFKDTSIIGADEKSLRDIRGDRISMVFQEPMTSLNPLHSIEKQIGEMLYLHKGLSIKQARPKIIELLKKVGLPNAEARLKAYPHELSGGQRQRVMIAMALANEPELLIADEPTTALDVTIQAQILELLISLQQQTGMSLLIITHDLNIVKKIANRVCVMKGGELLETAATEQLFNNPQHEYSRTLINAEPVGSANEIAKDAKLLLSANDLKVWFPLQKSFFGRVLNYVKAVDEISLNLKRGETLGIVGESGSGKTTLGMALLRLQKSEGNIQFNQHAINKLSAKAIRPLRKQFQIVFQDPFASLSPRMSIAEIIGEGLDVHEPELSAESREQCIIDIIKEVELDPQDRHRYPHEFSGGQRQRVAIARSMILKPALIILDEPTSALDRTVQSQILVLLKKMQQKYHISYIFISHDLAVVKAISHRILVMKEGKAVEEGLTKQITEQPKQSYTQQLMKAAFLD